MVVGVKECTAVDDMLTNLNLMGLAAGTGSVFKHVDGMVPADLALSLGYLDGNGDSSYRRKGSYSTPPDAPVPTPITY